MKNSDLSARVKAALGYKEVTGEQIALVGNTLRENMFNAGNQAMKFLLLFITSGTAWILVKFAYVQEVNILDIKLGNVDIVLLILPPIASFAIYQYQCYMALADVIHKVIIEIDEVKLKPFQEQGLSPLLTISNFLTVENSFANLAGNSGFFSKTTDTWIVFITLLFTFAPAVFLLWVCYSIITLPPIGIGWSIASAMLVVTLLFRTILIFAHWMSL